MCDDVDRTNGMGHEGGVLRFGSCHARQYLCITHAAHRQDRRAILWPPHTTGFSVLPFDGLWSTKVGHPLYQYTCTYFVRKLIPLRSRYSRYIARRLLHSLSLPELCVVWATGDFVLLIDMIRSAMLAGNHYPFASVSTSFCSSISSVSDSDGSSSVIRWAVCAI